MQKLNKKNRLSSPLLRKGFSRQNDKKFRLMRIKRNFFILVLFFWFFGYVSAVYSAPHYPGGDNIETYIDRHKNSIQNNGWLNQIDPLQLRYLRSIIEFFQLQDPRYTKFTSTYDNKVKAIDRGDLILGLFTSYGDLTWVITRDPIYATYDSYKSFVNNIINKIASAKLTYINSNMNGVAYTIKYNLGIMSSLSGAWNPRPDAKLQHRLMDSEGSLKYAFRINQQGLRHAILKHYMEELYEQKKEVAGFINFVKDLCNKDYSIYVRPDDLIERIRNVSAGSDFIAGNPIFYNRVLESLRNLAVFLFELNQRELTVMCTQAALLAWQSNIISTANELTLYQLGVIYNILQHFEK